jgi:hypothetical protein
MNVGARDSTANERQCTRMKPKATLTARIPARSSIAGLLLRALRPFVVDPTPEIPRARSLPKAIHPPHTMLGRNHAESSSRTDRRSTTKARRTRRRRDFERQPRMTRISKPQAAIHSCVLCDSWFLSQLPLRPFDLGLEFVADLRPLTTTSDFRLQAELLAGSQLDGTGGWTPLELGEVVARWKELKQASFANRFNE